MKLETLSNINLLKLTPKSFKNAKGETISYTTFTAIDEDQAIIEGTIHKEFEADGVETGMGIAVFELTQLPGDGRKKENKLKLVAFTNE